MKGILRRPLFVAVIAGAAIIVLGTSVVLGATVATNGGSVSAVLAKTATDTPSTVTSVNPVDAAGMSLSVYVPGNQQAMLVITFSAQTQCIASVAFSGCYIRVLLDGSPTRPGVVIFDSAGGSPVEGYWQAHSMQFVAGPVGPGTHYVRVQLNVGPQTDFIYGQRTLTVLRSQV